MSIQYMVEHELDREPVVGDTLGGELVTEVSGPFVTTKIENGKLHLWILGYKAGYAGPVARMDSREWEFAE